MKNKRKQYGVTLTELIVVVAVIALLIGLAIPAVKTFNSAINSSVSTTSMISAALSSARAMAAKHQKYAGIRFQQDKDGNQYMIPIIYDYNSVATTGLNNYVDAFTSVKGVNPSKLPNEIYVFDSKDNSNNTITSASVNNDDKFKDITSFSVIFSPSGSIVIRDVQICQKHADDPVFNNTGDYMFEKDSTSGTFPYAREQSRNSFIVCKDKESFLDIDENDRWAVFFEDPNGGGDVDPEKIYYINPYTGSIIGEK